MRPPSSRCCGGCRFGTGCSGALEAESGLNDAATVLLVVLLTEPGGLDSGLWRFFATAGYELLTGLAIGFLVGFGGAWLLRRVALPASGLYPVSVMTIAVLSYGGTVAIHASGFAAVYVTALVLGNSDLPHRTSTRSFAEGFGWLAQIGLFIMLGLLATPGEFRWHHVVEGLVIGAVLTVVARPLSVLACATPLRTPVRRAGVPLRRRPARSGSHRAGDHPAGRGLPECEGRLRPRVRAGDRPHPGPGAGAAGAGAPAGRDAWIARAISRSRQLRSNASRLTCCRCT